MKSLRWQCLISSALLVSAAPAAMAANMPPPLSRNKANQTETEAATDTLAISRDIAEQLDIIPILEKLAQFRGAGELDTRAEIERIKLKQALVYKVSVCTLQVRDATARIERELAYINRLRGLLEDRRDRAIKLNSIENVVASGGISEIGNTRSFAPNQTTNNVLQLVAGGATIGLGAWALKQQSGGTHRMEAKPNMLAEIFNLPVDADSKYPDLVWSYLNRAPVGSSKTRLQSLIDRWQRFLVIPRNIKTPAGQRRIAVLTNTVPNLKANIDVFDDRSDMLVDLRSEIFQMDRDLLDLVTSAKDAFQ